MSQSELITAYQRGVISRRGFVRGLVSLGATMAFANQLADQVAAAPAEQAAPRAFSSDIYDGGGNDQHRHRWDRDDEDDEDRNDRNQGGGGGGIANLIPARAPEFIVPIIPRDWTSHRHNRGDHPVAGRRHSCGVSIIPGY